jgi:hypothetical protein
LSDKIILSISLLVVLVIFILGTGLESLGQVILIAHVIGIILRIIFFDMFMYTVSYLSKVLIENIGNIIQVYGLSAFNMQCVYAVANLISLLDVNAKNASTCATLQMQVSKVQSIILHFSILFH